MRKLPAPRSSKKAHKSGLKTHWVPSTHQIVLLHEANRFWKGSPKLAGTLTEIWFSFGKPFDEYVAHALVRAASRLVSTPPPQATMAVTMHGRVIISDPEIMSGTPCFRGTRVPFKNLIDYLEGGHSPGEFLDQFPTVTREMAIQALEEANESLLARIA